MRDRSSLSQLKEVTTLTFRFLELHANNMLITVGLR